MVKHAAEVKAKSAVAEKQPPNLPDERFWKRYSQNHEFPLSTTSAIVAHALVFAVVFLFVILQLKRTEESKPLSVGAIVIAGGGGNPDGEGDGPGTPARSEDTGEVTEPKNKSTPNNPISKENLKNVAVNPLELPEFKGPDGRLLDDASDATKRLAGLSKDLQSKLMQGVAGPKPGKGLGGTGSGGGKDKGRGTGEGDLEGPGKGNISARQRRVLRWTMIFNTVDGYDYARQLAAMDAILAVPAQGDDYLVIRDLKRRPVSGQVEDLAKINRIFWVDDQPGSVGPLAVGLSLRPAPKRVVAFFPQWLEEKLLKLEKDYSGGKDEDQIKETRFRVVLKGRAYEPQVESQR